MSRGFRTALAFMAELAVLMALFIAVPVCLYMLAMATQ